MFVTDLYIKPLLTSKVPLSIEVQAKKLQGGQSTLSELNGEKGREETSPDVRAIQLGKIKLQYWPELISSDNFFYQEVIRDGSKSYLCLLILLNESVFMSDTSSSYHSGDCFYLFSGMPAHFLWSGKRRVLLLRLPFSACSELLVDTGIMDPANLSVLSKGIYLPASAKAMATNIINALMYCYENDELEQSFQRVWVKQVENMTTLFLGQFCHPSFTKNLDQHRQVCEESDLAFNKSSLNKLEKYLKKNLAMPIKLEDMARISGYSRSYLHKQCINHIGSSPMIWLRNLRLDAVRNQLQRASGQNITDVALMYGFTHMGRFSSYFYRRFGHYPAALKRGTTKDYP